MKRVATDTPQDKTRGEFKRIVISIAGPGKGDPDANANASARQESAEDESSSDEVYEDPEDFSFDPDNISEEEDDDSSSGSPCPPPSSPPPSHSNRKKKEVNGTDHRRLEGELMRSERHSSAAAKNNSVMRGPHLPPNDYTLYPYGCETVTHIKPPSLMTEGQKL